MDDATTTGNCISADIKIELVLSKLPESWGTFITMHSITTPLFKLLTKSTMKTFSDRRGEMLN